jgi:hypothetical protein
MTTVLLVIVALAAGAVALDVLLPNVMAPGCCVSSRDGAASPPGGCASTISRSRFSTVEAASH